VGANEKEKAIQKERFTKKKYSVTHSDSSIVTQEDVQPGSIQ
jgi:hypothetical protein